MPTRRFPKVWSILLVILVALPLRLVGITWGNPYAYYPDEAATFNPASIAAVTLDPNPHWFHYPSLLFDLEVSIIRIFHFLAGWPLFMNQLPDGGAGTSDIRPDLFPYVIAGRVLVALLGTVACLAVFQTLSALKLGTLAAAIGALSLGVAPVAVENAHYLTTDVMSSAFCALALWFSVLMLQGTRGAGLLTGVACGLAASSKYNAGLIVLIPVVLVLLQRRGSSISVQRLLVIAGAMIVSFAVTSPFVILDPTTSSRDILAEVEHYRNGHLGADGPNNWLWYASTLWSGSWGALPALASLAGFCFGIANRRTRLFTLALFAFSISYLVVIGAPKVHFARNLLPLLPPLAVSLGLSFGAFSSFRESATAIHVSNKIPTVTALLVAIGAVVVLAPTFLADVRADRDLRKVDTRTIALGQMERLVSSDAMVVREAYTPQLEWGFVNSRAVWTISDHDLAWYREQGFTYVVASSYQYDRYLQGDDARGAIYRGLFSKPPIAEITPEDPLAPGPTIRLYRLTNE